MKQLYKVYIVQGSEGNVYILNIVNGGPGDRDDIIISDQVICFIINNRKIVLIKKIYFYRFLP